MKLWLEDGTSFEGNSVGAPIQKITDLGEIVFNTSMTGYQEIIASQAPQALCP